MRTILTAVLFALSSFAVAESADYRFELRPALQIGNNRFAELRVTLSADSDGAYFTVPGVIAGKPEGPPTAMNASLIGSCAHNANDSLNCALFSSVAIFAVSRHRNDQGVFEWWLSVLGSGGTTVPNSMVRLYPY